MAIITGQTEHGCCSAAHYVGNHTYVCTPEPDELHRIHKIYNDYHMWYAKILGKTGEEVCIRLKWPVFDPEVVSDEYKNWKFYSVEWPSFVYALPESIYCSRDQIHWERVENAVRENNDILFSLHMLDNACYVSATLHYTPENYRNLLTTIEDSPYIRIINLGKAWDGSDLLTFVATDFSVPESKKKSVYFHGTQHCQEHTGAHIADFMLRFLASGAPSAREMLRKLIFRITPVVDKTGWRTGAESHPAHLGTDDFNYNRDWVDFTLPETRAIASYLKDLYTHGERFAFMADIHGGTGDENDYSSGAGISVDNSLGIEFQKRQEHFVDLVRQHCDYIDPDEKTYSYGSSLPTQFTGFCKRNFGVGFTFEVSMSKIWDRELGHRKPNSQEAFKRFAEQLAEVIYIYAMEE